MPAAAPERCAIVVAHPDDEALWLSSVLARSERIVFCFGAPFGRPQMAANRRNAVAALPLANLADLAIPESGAGFLTDRERPRLTPFGLSISDAAAARRYEANYARLLEKLRPQLSGFSDVYTHNPWGEYGHAEHVQVHRAVQKLQAELGFTLWFSNYVGPLSWRLAVELSGAACWSRRLQALPDIKTARTLMNIYRRYKAWTWTRFHRWPSNEVLYSSPGTKPMAGEVLLDARRLRPFSLRPPSRRLPAPRA